jgi:hypothetical protein
MPFCSPLNETGWASCPRGCRPRTGNGPRRARDGTSWTCAATWPAMTSGCLPGTATATRVSRRVGAPARICGQPAMSAAHIHGHYGIPRPGAAAQRRQCRIAVQTGEDRPAFFDDASGAASFTSLITSSNTCQVDNRQRESRRGWIRPRKRGPYGRPRSQAVSGRGHLVWPADARGASLPSPG